jgi:hypothetical protein
VSGQLLFLGNKPFFHHEVGNNFRGGGDIMQAAGMINNVIYKIFAEHL